VQDQAARNVSLGIRKAPEPGRRRDIVFRARRRILFAFGLFLAVACLPTLAERVIPSSPALRISANTEFSGMPLLDSCEGNARFLLATLHGEPGQQVSLSDSLHRQNRMAWNRWMAAAIDEVLRDKLIAKGRYPRAELTPLSEAEKIEWQTLFKTRAANHPDLKLPHPQAEISLSGLKFGLHFQFSGCIFPAHLDAKNASFEAPAPFQGCNFLGISDFSECRFGGIPALLRNNTFHNRAEFREAVFEGPASFLKTEFNGADFRKATFQNGVDFFFLLSNSNADFSGARFRNYAIFDNAEFKCRLSFQGAQFARPPLFLNSTLPDGLDLGEITWPRVSAETKEPQEFVQAYQRLKLEMDKKKLHEQELMFFGCEMQCRGAASGKKKWDGLAIAIYGALSDYGRSYVRPLGWLALLIVAGALAGAAITGGPLREAFGLSFVDTFGVFGFRKEFVDTFQIPKPVAAMVLGWFQTIVGSALIFLSLLALQKTFRMR